ncbi:Band 4.1-like protein 3 [Eumeta japonica]|uniref:Band 4.1-like protein 3 n=1 Tax=Eumeta variegata TaxID=151549 RepID=A0A4C1UBH9_EUMVA|nr:Band 4.1-like protein 3 [Eumeta japonica]
MPGAEMRDSLRRLASDDGVSRRMGAGKTRRVRVELLDGSQLDLEIDGFVRNPSPNLFRLSVLSKKSCMYLLNHMGGGRAYATYASGPAFTTAFCIVWTCTLPESTPPRDTNATFDRYQSEVAFHRAYSQRLRSAQTQLARTVHNNARNSAAVKLVTKVSQWRKFGTRERRRKGRGMSNLRITLIAGNSERQSFRKARGGDLLDSVCDALDLLEKDYFGLLHAERGDPRVWIDLGKRLSKTFKNEPWEVQFAVKFYPPEPADLKEDITRYQLQLAIRRDLLQGRPSLSNLCGRLVLGYRFPVTNTPSCSVVSSGATPLVDVGDIRREAVGGRRRRRRLAPPLSVVEQMCRRRLTCSPITYALLGSYILQAELGDYGDADIHGGLLAEKHVAPLNVLTPELEEKIMDLYKNHRGQTPATAELNYLDNAKKLPMYGAELHCVRDSEDIDLVLGICASGVSVCRDGLMMNKFPWAKIIKISYNKRVYTLRLRASEFDEFETLLSFKLPSTRASKKLWKCSVEQHMFFR